jgi:hypothetical protein
LFQIRTPRWAHPKTTGTMRLFHREPVICEPFALIIPSKPPKNLPRKNWDFNEKQLLHLPSTIDVSQQPVPGCYVRVLKSQKISHEQKLLRFSGSLIFLSPAHNCDNPPTMLGMSARPQTRGLVAPALIRIPPPYVALTRRLRLTSMQTCTKVLQIKILQTSVTVGFSISAGITKLQLNRGPVPCVQSGPSVLQPKSFGNTPRRDILTKSHHTRASSSSFEERLKLIQQQRGQLT